MDGRTARDRGRCILRRAAATAAAIITVAVMASGVSAQALSDPNSPPKWSPPKSGAKSPAAARAKSCSADGAGFVNVPGTDTCVKIGGWVGVEGGTR
jgi:hypothetical protein